MFGYTVFFQSLLDCVKQFTKYKTTKLEKQESSDIITNKNKLKKAGNIAEEIIEISNKYKSVMTAADKRKLNSLIKKFNKHD